MPALDFDGFFPLVVEGSGDVAFPFSIRVEHFKASALTSLPSTMVK